MTHQPGHSDSRLAPPRLVRRAVRWFAMALFLALPLGSVQATVPSGPPTFNTNPLTFTNRYEPFVPRATKVYSGAKSGGVKVIILENYLSETRTFQLAGANKKDAVVCSILREMEFDNNQLVEDSLNHFAQADDGTVYYFGEIVDIYQNGVVTSHEGSWLVGGPTRDSDPPETANAPHPFVFMPANPQQGDAFKQEDLYPYVDETDQVVAVNQTVTVPAGTYTNVIQVLESSRLDPSTEDKWYAPGVGVIQGRAKGETSQLIVSTLPLLLRSP